MQTSLGGCWRQDVQGSRRHLDFDRSGADDLAIAMKRGGPEGRQSHTLRAPAPHARCAKLAAEDQPWKQRQYSKRAEVFDQDHIKQAVVNLRFRRESQSRAVSRRIQHARKQRLASIGPRSVSENSMRTSMGT